jgi:hypothetical protein
MLVVFEKGELLRHIGHLDLMRAMQRAREILKLPGPAPFAPEMESRIRAEFPGLVSGELRMPEGWDTEDERSARSVAETTPRVVG